MHDLIKTVSKESLIFVSGSVMVMVSDITQNSRSRKSSDGFEVQGMLWSLTVLRRVVNQ